MSMNWKSRLGKLEMLLSGAASRAFEIATELRLLWNDKEFLSEACGGSYDKAEEILSPFTEATTFHLNELLQMLEHFPNQADWKDGQLRNMLSATLLQMTKQAKANRGRGAPAESTTGGTAGTDPPFPKRHRVSLWEHQSLQREKDAVERKAQELERLNRLLTEEAERLRVEVRMLLEKIPSAGRAA